MASVMFTVPGKPQGKARARTYYNASTKKHCSTTPENTVLYENFIKDRYLQMAKGAFLEREKPVTLRIIARYLPSKSVSKKRKLDMLEGRELPLKKPDMDNIVKVVADALNGVAYHDDTQ
ncbi:RusA family crossover junction endodeoxyribonuclease, partial [Allocoprococcus similis]